jgi:hypothetical protein
MHDWAWLAENLLEHMRALEEKMFAEFTTERIFSVCAHAWFEAVGQFRKNGRISRLCDVASRIIVLGGKAVMDWTLAGLALRFSDLELAMRLALRVSFVNAFVISICLESRLWCILKPFLQTDGRSIDHEWWFYRFHE